MDLTKLVELLERIPHEQNYCGSMNYSCQPDCLRCAFDAALAAVRQDIVDALIKEMRAQDEDEDQFCVCPSCEQSVKALFTSVLASRWPDVNRARLEEHEMMCARCGKSQQTPSGATRCERGMELERLLTKPPKDTFHD